MADFLAWIAEELAGEDVQLAAADRYKQAEAQDAMDAAEVYWSMEWRAVGSGQHGSADIRAFQRGVESGELRPGESLLLTSAIAESALRHDGNNNPSLNKGRSRGRIDALSAAVLAVGLGTRHYGGDGESFFLHVAL